MRKIQRALISVSNKEGIIEFSKELADMDIEILSTGGTARSLRKASIPVVDVSNITGFPEILDGRVKTLHPKIHGGLLGIQDNQAHIDQLEEHEIKPIQLLVVNLYPFEETINKTNCTLAEAIENIDIGGPSMLRSSAKNYHDVAVIINPSDYHRVLNEMRENNQMLSDSTRLELATQVFLLTSRYDALIHRFLQKQGPSTSEVQFGKSLNIELEKVQDLRYGENPHQKAAFYRDISQTETSVSNATQLHGKEMSFNNFLDANSALELVKEFEKSTAVIIKHNNPCGVASALSLLDAYTKARETDPNSAFGGVIAFNRPVDEILAKELASTFIEVIIAPGFDPASLDILKKKLNLRLLDIEGKIRGSLRAIDYRKVVGGMLVQERDLGMVPDFAKLPVVTKRKPTQNEYEALGFAWKVCKHVKSNAIIFASGTQTAGIGAGQMSRVDSVNLASLKANLSLQGSSMASDAFFPFRDGIDRAAKEGITSVIQPGGSKRDSEVIQAADEHGMAMIFTGMRHFRH